MPSWELFLGQDESYRESVLPKRIKARVTVEAASPLGWYRWAGDEGVVIGLERFGASAPGEEVLQHLGFTHRTRGIRRASHPGPNFGSRSRVTRPKSTWCTLNAPLEKNRSLEVAAR